MFMNQDQQDDEMDHNAVEEENEGEAVEEENEGGQDAGGQSSGYRRNQLSKDKFEYFNALCRDVFCDLGNLDLTRFDHLGYSEEIQTQLGSVASYLADMRASKALMDDDADINDYYEEFPGWPSSLWKSELTVDGTAMKFLLQQKFLQIRTEADFDAIRHLLGCDYQGEVVVPTGAVYNELMTSIRRWSEHFTIKILLDDDELEEAIAEAAVEDKSEDVEMTEMIGEAFEDKSGVGGGVEDFYGEDSASEEAITPWIVSVASGYTLIHDPRHNKGLAFTEKERDAHHLTGLLPPAVFSQNLQEKQSMKILRDYEAQVPLPLQRYMAMMDLQERNEKLFYKLLIDNVEELLPVFCSPTVGEACQKYGNIFRSPQGLYISLKEKGRILKVLKNWPEKSIQVIVVTDGESIIGLGDLGCQGMGIPVGKLSLYTALGGVRPSACLPITIDVGTNNKKLLEDEFYIGLKQNRVTGLEYYELLEEFMSAVKQNYGKKVLIQFDDFANHNAFELLAKYRSSHLVFNDDIQGTASVVLAGLIAALKLVGGTLADHTFLFSGAGEAGTGIAELIALEISKKTDIPLEEARKEIWLFDSGGLIVSSRKESLQHFEKPWAHEHEPLKELLAAVKAIKPSVLIGTSSVGKAFTKEVVEAMAFFNEKPLLLALPNPTSQSECTAEEEYTWSEGHAIFASGQANNAYIFPGFGLGLIVSGIIHIHDDLLLAASAAEALAAQVTEENYAKGLIYPRLQTLGRSQLILPLRLLHRHMNLVWHCVFPVPKILSSLQRAACTLQSTASIADRIPKFSFHFYIFFYCFSYWICYVSIILSTYLTKRFALQYWLI